MAEYSSFVITTKGQALMSKLITGSGSCSFTAIKTSSTVYTQEQLESLTALTNIKQSAEIANVTRIDNVSINIKASLNNTDLVTGYSINTIGLYATDPDEGEILYAVARAIQAGYMPSNNSVTSSGISFNFTVTVGNSENVIINIVPAAFATQADVAALEVKIDGKWTFNAEEIKAVVPVVDNLNSTSTTSALSANQGKVLDGKISAVDAMRYKGTLGTGGTVTALPNTFRKGDTYRVITAGTYLTHKVEVGDMIIALLDRTSGSSVVADWSVVQANIDGAVVKKPGTYVKDNLPVYDSTTGQVIRDSGVKATDITDNKTEIAKLKAKYNAIIIGCAASGVTADQVDYFCDGTDDHVQIQEAIDNSSKRRMYILPGTYYINSDITISVVGAYLEGIGSVFLQFNKNSDFDIYFSPGSTTFKNLCFYDLRYFNIFSSDNTIKNCSFLRLKGYIAIQYTNKNIFENIYITGNNSGIWFEASNTCIFRNITIKSKRNPSPLCVEFGSNNNFFENINISCMDNTIDGMYFNYVSSNTIINLTCAQGKGVKIEDSDNLSFFRCNVPTIYGTGNNITVKGLGVETPPTVTGYGNDIGSLQPAVAQNTNDIYQLQTDMNTKWEWDADEVKSVFNIVDNLNSDSSTDILSARQGKVLDGKITAVDAMRYKGTLGTSGTITALPNVHRTGDTYRVITAGTYLTHKVEVGDMFIALTDKTSGSTTSADWSVIQANIDGAVVKKPGTYVKDRLPVYDDTTGQVIRDSGVKVTDITNSISNLAGTGHTNETVKANADEITALKARYDALIVGTSTSGHTQAQVDLLCDGADDHVQIQEAINHASKRKVIILSGTYQIKGNLSFDTAYTDVEGVGHVVFNCDTQSSIDISINKAGVSLRGIYIENLTTFNSFGISPTFENINFGLMRNNPITLYSNYAKMKNITIDGMDTGLILDGSKNGYFESISVSTNGTSSYGALVFYSDADANFFEKVTIKNVTPDRPAVYLEGARNTIIDMVADCGSGIKCFSAESNKIIGLKCKTLFGTDSNNNVVKFVEMDTPHTLAGTNNEIGRSSTLYEHSIGFSGYDSQSLVIFSAIGKIVHSKPSALTVSEFQNYCANNCVILYDGAVANSPIFISYVNNGYKIHKLTGTLTPFSTLLTDSNVTLL